MKRGLAAALSLSLASCATVPEPTEPPQPGDKIQDARTAMRIARKLCDVPALHSSLSPYRWRVARQGGIWHVRVPSLRYGLADAYTEVDIRAADGMSPKGCPRQIGWPIVIAGAG